MREEELDQEWVALVMEARNRGIAKEDILLFLKGNIVANSLASTYKEQEIFE